MKKLGKRASYEIGKQFIHEYASIFDLADDDGYNLHHISGEDIDWLKGLAREVYNYWINHYRVKVDKIQFIEGVVDEILKYRRKDYLSAEYIEHW